MQTLKKKSVTSYVRTYFLNVFRWLDCGLNCVLLFGSYNETVSRRAAYARDANRRWGCILCKILDTIRKNHCENAKKELIGEDALIPDQD